MSVILEGIFPHYCVLCGLRSFRSQPLCEACERDIPRNQNACTTCAIPLALPEINPEASADTKICGKCLTSPPTYDKTVAPWLYTEFIAHLIRRWKYHGERRLTPLLAYLLQSHVGHLSDVDALVPVPLHWTRHLTRGFNQSQLLCQHLQSNSTVLQATPIIRRVRRSRATKAQATMSATERALNLQGVFTVNQPCDNLRLAIVDDVFTTGATASAFAKSLREAGASHIEIWCLARTPAPFQ